MSCEHGHGEGPANCPECLREDYEERRASREARRASRGQTRRGSLIEASVNILAGIGVAFTLNANLLPAIGVEISTAQNAAATFFYTVASLLRSYALRRIFNRWSAK